MKKLIVAAGLALAGLSTPAMSSPEKPTLLETAAFLITGSRAEDFIEVAAGVLGRPWQIRLEGGYENYFAGIMSGYPSGSFEYISVTQYGDKDGSCAIGHIITSGKAQGYFKNAINVKLYHFKALDGKISREYVFNNSGQPIGIKETLPGKNAVCKVNIVSGEFEEDQCDDNFSFVANDKLLSDSRDRAWRYLFKTYCSPLERPF